MSTRTPNTTNSKMASPCHDDNQIRMLGLHKEDMERFGKVLRAMNLDSIPDFASNVRQYGHHSTGNNSTQNSPGPCSIGCRVIYPPLCGSFHIIFPIEFADGVKWMLKVSAKGNYFDSVAAAALASEARTMQMLERETSIPIPTIYAFDTSPDNVLLAPFILMKRLSGRPLYHLWFNSEVPKASLEHFRVKTLQSLAGAMAQLNKFTLNTGGSLVFDSGGTPIGLGGAKVVDGVAIFNKSRACQIDQQDCDENDRNSPNEYSMEAAKPRTTNASECSQAGAHESDDDGIICERGPFTCPKAYFLSNLDRSDPAFRADAYERGTDMSLRLFIEWAFPDSQDHDRQFVLTHPDLDVQNILVADDGTLTGLIDWDGVASVPREVGCAQYPLWLMRDWVPLRYKYDIQEGKPCIDAGYEESSPAEIASYRAVYAQLMEVEIEKMTGGSDETTTLGTLPKHEADLTRRSLVMRNLDLSAGDPWVALSTVNHIIDQIEEVTAPDWEGTESDMDSISSCSSVSDSESDIDSDSDEEDTQAKGPTTNKQSLSGMRGDASTHSADQKLDEMERIVPATTENVHHSSWGALGRNQMSSTSMETYLSDTGNSKTDESFKTHPQDDSTPSSPLDWTQRLLQFGCNIAEKFMKRIAKIDYDLKDAIDDEAEASAEVKIQNLENPAKESSEQVVSFDTLQRTSAVERSEHLGTKKFDDNLSRQNTGGLEQVSEDIWSIGSIADSQVIPLTRPVNHSEQMKKTDSIPSTIKPQDIPLRKAELLQAARVEKKAERKAHYRADKAAIKKELKVWEQIALAVWCRGVSLEQLQIHQGKIADWVVDTLRTEKEHGESPLANGHLLSAAEATAAVAETTECEAAALRLLEEHHLQSNEKPEEVRLEKDAVQTANVKNVGLSTTSKFTIANSAEPNFVESKVSQSSLKKSFIATEDSSAPEKSMPDIFEDENDELNPLDDLSAMLQPQDRLCLARGTRYSKPNDENTRTRILSPAKGGRAADLRSLSGSSSTSGDSVLPATAKASSSLQSFCKSSISHVTQIFFKHNRSKEYKACSSVESSVLSDGGEKEGGRSDSGDAHSSATSLSDGEAEDRQNEKAKEDTGGTPETTAIAANKDNRSNGGGDEQGEEPEEDGHEGWRSDERIRRRNDQDHTLLTKSSLEADGSVDTGAPRRVYNPSNGDWVEARKDEGPVKAENPTSTRVEVGGHETRDTMNRELEGDTNNNGCQGNQPDEDEGDDTSSDSELPEFEDHGGFDRYTVCNLLGRGELDELRLLRLKEGFSKLLEQY